MVLAQSPAFGGRLLHRSLKLKGDTRRWNEPEPSGTRRGLKKGNFRDGCERGKVAREANTAATDGPSAAEQLLVDARPLL